MIFRPMPGGLHFWHPAALLATGGGIGLARVASGTWGSLAALPLAWGIVSAAGLGGLLLAAVLAWVGGVWASAYIGRSGEKDSSAIVIDEIAGQWLSLLPCALDPVLYAMAFLAFRFFDIVKPWPASWIDREVGGGFGVMLDDVVAGIYAGTLVWALSFWM
jgi:phosphatidylglycerophosphatase A